MEGCPAVQSGEAPTPTMSLKNQMLSVRSQTQKVTYCLIPCLGNVQNWQIQRQKADPWWPGGGRQGLLLGGWRHNTGNGLHVPELST